MPDPRAPIRRIVFMGTADLAASVLSALAASQAWQVVAALSQPDRPRGRDLRLQPTPVKVAAERLGIPVLQPARARDPQCLDALRDLAPDVIAVAAYGQLLPPTLLAIPRLGCVNVHTSLLPRWRGAAPIAWAIASDDARTGVTILLMDAGLDTGPILSQESLAIAPEETGATLHDRLAELGGRLLVETLPRLASGEIQPRPQPSEGVTLARKITRDDGRLDWTADARVLSCRIRAFTPWPGGWTESADATPPRRIKIHRATTCGGLGVPGTVIRADDDGIVVACGSGCLRILELQEEGGRRLQAAHYLAGHRPTQFR